MSYAKVAEHFALLKQVKVRTGLPFEAEDPTPYFYFPSWEEAHVFEQVEDLKENPDLKGFPEGNDDAHIDFSSEEAYRESMQAIKKGYHYLQVMHSFSLEDKIPSKKAIKKMLNDETWADLSNENSKWGEDYDILCLCGAMEFTCKIQRRRADTVIRICSEVCDDGKRFFGQSLLALFYQLEDSKQYVTHVLALLSEIIKDIVQVLNIQDYSITIGLERDRRMEEYVVGDVQYLFFQMAMLIGYPELCATVLKHLASHPEGTPLLGKDTKIFSNADPQALKEIQSCIQGFSLYNHIAGFFVTEHFVTSLLGNILPSDAGKIIDMMEWKKYKTERSSGDDNKD